MTPRIRLLALLCLATLATPLAAQSVTRANENAWLAYFGDHRLGTSRWSVWFDGQLRRSEWGAEPMQLLLRPGLTYEVSPGVRVSAGVAYVSTSGYGAFGGSFTPEIRPWQQLIVRGLAGRVNWQVRTRTEQRFLGVPVAPAVDPDGRDWRTVWRLREFVRMTVPIGAARITPGRVYFAAQNELFLRTGGQTSGLFDQNRAYAGLGIELRRGWRVEAGYMNHYLARGNNRQREVNHTLHLALFSTAPF